MNLQTSASWIKPIAKLGLAAKGTVYCLIGLLAIMSAFHLGGQTSKNTNKEGVFQFVLDQPGGKLILAVISLGLLSYAVWRFLQAFFDIEHKGSTPGGIGKRFTYFVSGLTYLALAWFSLKFLMNAGSSAGGANRKSTVNDILSQPFGQWLLIIIAIIMAATGIYQIWYGTSEKYRKHVSLQELDPKAAKALMRAGKIGYISRGIVWLLIAFLFAKAALQRNAAQAGDTGSAFGFVEQSTFGTYLLAALGLGLICYGVMNFVRAAFEKFRN